QAFSNIAQVAALPRLVRREQIAAAQALNTSSLGVAALIGPGLGGAVVALGRTTLEGAALAFVVDASTSLVSTSMLASIRAAVPGGARRRAAGAARRGGRGAALPVGRPADPAPRGREHGPPRLPGAGRRAGRRRVRAERARGRRALHWANGRRGRRRRPGRL